MSNQFNGGNNSGFDESAFGKSDGFGDSSSFGQNSGFGDQAGGGGFGGFGSQSFGAAPLGNETPALGLKTNSLKVATGPWPEAIATISFAVLGLLLGILAFAVGGSATDSGFRNFSIAGWVCSGILTFVALGLFTNRDVKRQVESLYISNGIQQLCIKGGSVIALLGILLTAIEIALWVGKAAGA